MCILPAVRSNNHERVAIPEVDERPRPSLSGLASNCGEQERLATSEAAANSAARQAIEPAMHAAKKP
jgi:hypothetical protein